MEFFVNPRGVVIKGKGPNAATTDRKYLFTTKGKRLTIVRYDKGESVTVFVGKVANKMAYNAYAANESVHKLTEDEASNLAPAVTWTIANLSQGGQRGPEPGFVFPKPPKETEVNGDVEFEEA